MTGRPTRRFDIGTRGRIQRGYYAESTLLEAERMVDTVTFNHPRKHPASIPYVLANGQVAVGDDHCTGVLAGRRCHESGVQDQGGP